MAPLIALIAGSALARLVGLVGVDALDGWWPALRVGLALMFVLTGLAHFGLGRREGLIAMVPPALPNPALLVTVTGVLELAGAAGLLLPTTARLAGACLALLMVVMFPANVSAARRHLELGGRPVTPLAARIPMQLLFIAAAVAVAVGG
ncbi:DoxX family membrane protein [Actinoplanes sp. LDG1-06]|uniref:DoxX family membrane protein n=1 Tax=Paractinoplanes ovalisporus TaxID=2810368 RepID=A0ABS2AQM1_9ACTN|nr:DoxX family membrane protein [Actinoplanes ovalisporus]MBM2622153.1 DoxX family membrane protein [Actinoplanes ovalisporus]